MSNIVFSPDDERHMVRLGAIYLYWSSSIVLNQRAFWEGEIYNIESLAVEDISHFGMNTQEK